MIHVLAECRVESDPGKCFCWADCWFKRSGSLPGRALQSASSCVHVGCVFTLWPWAPAAALGPPHFHGRPALLSLCPCLVLCPGPHTQHLERKDPAQSSQALPVSALLGWSLPSCSDNIPEDLRDPFYIDQYEQEHIKPPVIKLLLSSELYCRVCSLILKGDQAAALQGHQSVIQALSRKGIYVMESDDTPVTDTDLGYAPIKMSAHMAMVDALMMAYTVEMISIEKVVASVKRFSTFSASKELPYDLEDAMVFWINKVRYRREHLSARQSPYFPLLEDLMRGSSDGAALLAVVHYYCPEQMRLDDICLKEVPSMADSLYNIRLLREFANEHLNKCFYLTLEDMLYAPLVLKPNVMVFIAELFWWFENVKPDFVQPRDVQELKDAKTVLQQKSSRPPVPISNATKRSFLGSPAAMSPADLQPTALPAEGGLRYHLHSEDAECLGKGTSAFSPSHPLLPLRQKQQKAAQAEETTDQRHRSNSLTRVDGQPRGTAVAWPEKKNRPVSQPTPFALHHATSCEVDPGSGDSISLARSISKDSLASNIIHLTPQNQPHPTAGKANGKSLLSNVSIEDEEEELMAIIRTDVTAHRGDLEVTRVSPRAPVLPASARSPQRQLDTMENKPDSFFLEPLMPAVLRPAKEKQIITKEDECGEGRPRSSTAKRSSEGPQPLARKKVTGAHGGRDLNRTFTPIPCSEFVAGVNPAEAHLRSAETLGEVRGGPLAIGGFQPSPQGQPADGFFLHVGRADEDAEGRLCISSKSPSSQDSEPWTLLRQDSDSDVVDIEDAEQDFVGEDHPLVITAYAGEEESAKLQEDMKVREHEDKDGASGRSSPCLSTASQLSSVSLASGSVKMTSFAERKLQRLNSYETKSSTSSSQKTTPDASESCPAPLTTWRQKREQSPGRHGRDAASLLASELVQLHMQLEEKRRAIEAQKKKMEALSARQRLKLGKAAFLHVVKKGKADSAPQPLRPEHFAKEYAQHNGEEVDSGTSRTEGLLARDEQREGLSESRDVDGDSLALVQPHRPREAAVLHDMDKSKMISTALLEDGVGEGVDVTECELSIEKLNETISTLQQAILKISQQQEQLLMKSPTIPMPSSKSNSQDQKVKAAIHFVEPLSPPGVAGHRKPPRLGQGRNSRSGRPAELKVPKDRQQGSSRSKTPTPSMEGLPHLRPFPQGHPQRTPPEPGADGAADPSSHPPEKGLFDSYRLHDESNQRTFVLSSSKDPNVIAEQMGLREILDASVKEGELSSCSKELLPAKEAVSVEEPLRSKASLIEVDLSHLKAPSEDGEVAGQDSTTELISDVDQKPGVGFFFKDEQKAEDELAKKRAAFLLKQQRKAEEARVRKQQLEAEVELKRDEARRKAEEDRIRKEEEKARRELIKQEYLRRKQQQILEEQGLSKPKSKPKKPRPKSVHREESCSDSGTKCSSTPDNLSRTHSGSSLSLASAATTEPESVHSGGTPSQRVESLEALPILSRNPSRSTDRDWETASAASSLASVAEYTGPKLFKEPSSKSNKPIIHNAVSHCCLAGKVNEPHKHSVLEELEKCDANHYIILFRDAGCQFRALYCYYPDTEEIYKLTGTGPKSITKKMIDKLYKYSSDRKQFNLIPAKTMSVSVDALTIHSHLWQPKRPAVPKKTQTRK
ncbi:PREDICTED: calmodulin-regulated spectrin-associated protein 1 isoform X3 [Chinchilla lanigera]|uniref:calmodulin-regulated spectrin-associated protein 1 isoform X3 n=1 Tax=Chinchilla lanigera TaxID=34839 RepID=UPI0006966EB3|nr:PREDICTED: calmodulin-regulated spectrin-associated protein 1 isoform X3 [Chinchilla lanigera]